jgi:ribosome-binding factor A
MSSSKRVNQVANLLQRELAALLAQRHLMRNPLLHGVSITKVGLSPDLKLAKIYYLVDNDADLKAVDEALEHAQGFFRRLLAERVHLRYMPALRFMFDEMVPRAARIRDLLSASESDASAEDVDLASPERDAVE